MSILRQSGSGDMMIEVSVETPIKLSKKQKELMRQFEEMSKSENNSPKSENFFDKVKSFWK